MRTESYRDFIYQNPHIFKDKVGKPAQNSVISAICFFLSDRNPSDWLLCSFGLEYCTDKI